MAKKKKKNGQKILTYIFLGIVLLFLITFFVSGLEIGREVKNQCKFAQKMYQESCPDSLILLLNDKENSYRSRNSAVWALGQLGTKQALPILRSYYTGELDSKEPLDSAISQHELRKAIGLTKGGFNITAFIWRHNL
jgi:hypothetical protein